MCLTAERAAQIVNGAVGRRGVPVYINGSTTPVQCVVDENPARLAREMPMELEGHVHGAAALFDFPTEANVKPNDIVTYRGVRWVMYPSRQVQLDGGTNVRMVFYGTAGAP